ncbi:MAG: hypothetical protein AB202_02045 [Parcubacteria bacterium C7867-007]|nr:MAG: hypothetical protein AB202_02045 [Parcubacteria bacterium C7867-007]
MKNITTPAVALAVLIAATPFAAFAESMVVEGSAGGDLRIDQPIKGENIAPLYIQGKPIIKVREGASSTIQIRGAEKVEQKRPEPAMVKAKVAAAADTGIDARIQKLNDVLIRLDKTERLSDSARASIKAAVTGQIQSLKDVKVKIETNSTSTVKERMNTANQPFRAAGLILPKAAITAAADRIMTIAGQMEVFSAKIEARIDAASAAGTDVSAARTALANFDAKVASAKVNAQAAAKLVATVSADKEADEATFKANVAALREAKLKIDAAQADLKAARTEIGNLLKSIKGKGEVRADASVKASAQ